MTIKVRFASIIKCTKKGFQVHKEKFLKCCFFKCSFCNVFQTDFKLERPEKKNKNICDILISSDRFLLQNKMLFSTGSVHLLVVKDFLCKKIISSGEHTRVLNWKNQEQFKLKSKRTFWKTHTFTSKTGNFWVSRLALLMFLLMLNLSIFSKSVRQNTLIF